MTKAKCSAVVAMVEISIVADATEYWVGIGNRGLKATAKVMPTLRVEEGLRIIKHSKGTIFCLVEFKDVPLDAMPRIYLASPLEIAAWLKAAAAGRGDTILYEEHIWSLRARATGTIDKIPSSWKFTEGRLNEMALLAQHS